MKYTLVRHTGWTIGFNPQFQQAVELTGVGSDIMEKQIQKAGGYLADTYQEASCAEFAVNYPPSALERSGTRLEDGEIVYSDAFARRVKGLIPHARGTFTPINRTEVYVLTSDDVLDIANTPAPSSQ